MGCNASTEKNSLTKPNESTQKTIRVSEETVLENDVEKFVTLNEANQVPNDANKSTDGQLVSPKVSLEILHPTPPVSKQKKKKSNRKKLKQVTAWSRKSTIVETDFLKDLRSQRGQNNPFYEQEYEKNEVDESARLEGDDDSGMAIDDEESFGDVLIDDLSNEIFSDRKNGGADEECFDVTKIIDVEKFRAANNAYIEKNDAEKVNKVDLNFKTSFTRTRRQTRFHVKTSPENEDLYNDDDKNLIMSIEKEYLTNEDNILPGQIID
ncbi:uncharacterized protein LOC124451966 [Xenia sp. Carnegie-2017]|uniref:uncharacterized protein LOC124451966 n=1 Tax=Xenia sp. Carnegie-2017 TaxID=2897299 RepID=UPI001F038D80|nr:uncharacterized protein LOC124451966 [Xenia sp. Carnegie-2017]